MDWGKTKHFAGICLAVIFAVSLGAFAEVSFNAGGSGEVIWWTEYLDDQFNGGSPALCSPEDMGVELSAYNSGDWAAVLLDCAIRFELAHMTQPPEIEYRHMNPFNNPYTADSGPRVVLLLETTGLSPREYLAVSDPAPEFDRTCSTKHIPTRWWYAEWDGA
ncbi:hypothetical protein KAH43_08130, partial [Candidatus Bipolaricaulota bacterium]|nr:hypothetical protein [Candidatus Bipolaricaulota bacterium]